MRTNRRIWLLPLAILLLAACAEAGSSDPATPSPTAAATSISEVVQPAATATATAEPSPSPTPTTLLVVNDQDVDEEGLITVARVAAPEAAWLVIHADAGGQPGAVLGATAVGPGEGSEVTVSVDLAEITPRLHAVLHQDAGQPGEFDFPGPDEALSGADDAASASFEVELVGLVPSLRVVDQDVGTDGVVTVAGVTMPAPGWVVLHADEGGRPGAILNFAPVRRGENRQIAIPIDWRQATPRLFAMLHEDTGRPGRFNFPQADPPLAIAGQPVFASFTARMPPDILAFNQPVIDGAIEIERAVSYGPGWVVVYRQEEEEERPGNIIGWAPLEDGINRRVVVTLTQTALTPQLYLTLHEDTGDEGEFGFPVSDPPVRVDGRLPNPTVLDTTPGSYLITQDQPLSSSGTISIPLVVVNEPVWVVVAMASTEMTATTIGRTWVPAGVNHDVVVAVEPDQTPLAVTATLHRDAGTELVFDYPDGPDTVLQRNLGPIQAPFDILEAVEE